MPKPNSIDALIEQLRANGFSDDVLGAVEHSMRADAEHRCQSCGRSPSGVFMEIECDGEVAYASPSRLVYCYRGGRPFGLCDQCFHANRFDGFTPFEIAYFRESFKQSDETGEGA